MHLQHTFIIGFPAYENDNSSVWVDSFGYDVMVNDNSYDCIMA